MGSVCAVDVRSGISWLVPSADHVLTMVIPRGYSVTADTDHISRSSGGDKRAFDEIVTRHGPFALRVTLRPVPDQAIAEDIVQDAMVKAWSQARQFDPEREPEGFRP